jgi:hypothetical protein
MEAATRAAATVIARAAAANATAANTTTAPHSMPTPKPHSDAHIFSNGSIEADGAE